MNRSCDKCRWSEAEGAQLYCHLLPPTPVIEQGVGMHVPFPPVLKKAWCSFFKLSLKKLLKGDGTRT